MVGAHPSIAITPESHWIPRYFENRRGLTPEGLVTPKLVSKLLGHSRFSRLKISREELEGLSKSSEPVSYATFVTGIFNLYGKAQGKPLVGDKTPGYTQCLSTLHTLWPTARFVHLIRDGRNVCLSALNWEKASELASHLPTWNDDPVSTAAVWWAWHVRLGREAGSSLGPNLYYEIGYESLVANPADECRALCTFLDVPYDDAMLRFHEGRTRTDPGLSAKDAWLPITPGLRDWRTQMAAEDVERFEAVAGDLLDELGYWRAIPDPKREAQKHASLIYEMFTQDARSRRERLLQKGS
jgi:hypothetical protein